MIGEQFKSSVRLIHTSISARRRQRTEQYACPEEFVSAAEVWLGHADIVYAAGTLLICGAARCWHTITPVLCAAEYRRAVPGW